ncbi:fibrous sheath CABYR-binding protein [Drosophila teissieri]|uniref:fibrous sheath CABYR-binding protein n=1 Tax=Drosophila teissieri TaxID=7243 RepID=UPI001CB9F190|nr:fibrous sheath CABYR-binding protein [Drosophila teissieri]
MANFPLQVDNSSWWRGCVSKIFSLSGVLTLSAVASVALGAPQLESRFRRDVSELVDPAAVEYLPPSVTEAVLLNAEPVEAEAEAQADPAAQEAEPEGTVLGDNGYEYRTVRRLKLRHRNRRDVSHLQPARQYLPPSNAYLPPAQEAAAAPEAPAAAPPADDTEEVVSAAQPKVNREYLPPTEAAPAAEETTEAVAPEEPADVRVVDVPTVSGQLLQDGYHYQQPAEMPAELREAAPEYLPPVGGEEVIVEGPAGGESAVLGSDGYQYRAIRRYRF